MSLLHTRLDSTRWQSEENDVFTRLITGEFWDEEEVRYDRPDSYSNTYAYVGLAKSGASVMDPVWSCVRRSYDAKGKVYRDQFKAGIAWVDRANGWI